MTTVQLRLFVAGVMVAVSQNCSCPPGLCCSLWGYCGTTADYCGDGCKSGPCYSDSLFNSRASVADVASPSFFDGILGQAGASCPGKSFYSREAFLSATASYPNFGRGRTEDDTKREIAAFFAHVTGATGFLCHIESVDASQVNCDSSNEEWPCVAGKKYYGRGPIQLTWNSNYGPAGQSIGFDGLGEPEKVATNPVISFKTALWYWMNFCHSLMSFGEGFGATIRAVNYLDCDGKNPTTVRALVDYYKNYCSQFGFDTGSNLTC